MNRSCIATTDAVTICSNLDQPRGGPQEPPNPEALEARPGTGGAAPSVLAGDPVGDFSDAQSLHSGDSIKTRSGWTGSAASVIHTSSYQDDREAYSHALPRTPAVDLFSCPGMIDVDDRGMDEVVSQSKGRIYTCGELATCGTRARSLRTVQRAGTVVGVRTSKT